MKSQNHWGTSIFHLEFDPVEMSKANAAVVINHAISIKHVQYHTTAADFQYHNIYANSWAYHEFHATKAKQHTGLVRVLRHILLEVPLFAPNVSLALLSDLQLTHGFFLVLLPTADSLQAKGVQLILDLCRSLRSVFSKAVAQVPCTTKINAALWTSTERFQRMSMDNWWKDGWIEETDRQTIWHIHTAR